MCVNLIHFFFPPQLQKKQKEQLNLENKVNKNKDVINALTEHLKNLRQEVSHTQVGDNCRRTCFFCIFLSFVRCIVCVCSGIVQSQREGDWIRGAFQSTGGARDGPLEAGDHSAGESTENTEWEEERTGGYSWLLHHPYYMNYSIVKTIERNHYSLVSHKLQIFTKISKTKKFDLRCLKSII